jgi:ATP-dependent Zn protease
LCARAVANRTDACFIRVIGSELVQKYVGEGARMVRELFEMARSKKACLIFFDEIDAIGKLHKNTLLNFITNHKKSSQVAPVSMMVLAVTMKCREPCWS